jgi:hypothetical protein
MPNNSGVRQIIRIAPRNPRLPEPAGVAAGRFALYNMAFRLEIEIGNGVVDWAEVRAKLKYQSLL